MSTRFGKYLVKLRNKRLCKLYPFLVPWNRFTGERIADFDYSFTELDALPAGWKKRFGLNMCKEIKEALIEDHDLYRFRFVQIKEKYGFMRLYDNGCKDSSRVQDIERKYEQLSKRVCIMCGADAKWMSLGWVAPFCDKCRPFGVEPIDEYYREVEDS